MPSELPPASQFSPACPACGYLRAGIASDARCPECGAEGFDGVVTIAGTPRTGYSGFVALLVINVAIVVQIAVSTYSSYQRRAALLASLPAWRSQYALQNEITNGLVLGALPLLALLLLGRVVIREHRHRIANDGRPESITWTAHPRGVEIRTPSRSTWIPRDEIARIECADSLFGPVSQLQLIRKRTSKAGIIGSTPVLYVRGTADERRAQWRAFRAAAGLS